MNLALYSYLAAALAYSFFCVLLLFSWRESLQARLIVIVMFVSACWALFAAQVTRHHESYLLLYQVFEILRYIAWYAFLLKLFDLVASGVRPSHPSQKHSYQKFVDWVLPLSIGFALLLLFSEVFAAVFTLPGQFVFGIFGNLGLALIGLAIIEQLYRNTSVRHRWATKYLFFGAGGIFVFDFYLYADALLFGNIDQDLWVIRGMVHVIAIPLLAISAARNKSWSLNIFVSRDIVLNTTVIFGGALYLLAMGASAYYLRVFGDDWGKAGQIIFLTLAVMLFLAILTSSKIRAKVKVFLGKHFYKNKYDYRIEWLRLADDLKVVADNKNYYKTVIEVMAHIVDARTGSLWMCDEKGNYRNVEVWQGERRGNVIAADASLIKFLAIKGFVINVKEQLSHEGEYQGLLLPEWLLQADRAWLIVPLHGVDVLQGFVVLGNPLITRSINWEDHDLLKTAAKQITSYLAVLTTSAQLAEAKQFEMFTRLSAYMVHDLKNISAELGLIAANAKKHGDNPAFVKDAFSTVEHAAEDINRLLVQLRHRRVQHKNESEQKVWLDLTGLIAEVVGSKKHLLPVPQFMVLKDSGMLLVEAKRFKNVLNHLMENAQQATTEDDDITVTLSASAKMHIIEVKDTGQGMGDDFIRHRLFKPFDTTKGSAGMGIGMYESREFIRHLGGDINVQSKPGKGSIITLQIPLCSI